MKSEDSLIKTIRLLTLEASFVSGLAETPVAKNLSLARGQLLAHLREVGKSDDLALIVATEKAIVQGDIERYANSSGMISSLKNALNELEAAQRHMAIVGDKEKYQKVDAAHSLSKNRKAGLPYDEARQAFDSHCARLNNLDKSRLDADEKNIIDARKSNIWNAGKQYALQQAKTLGAELKQSAQRSR